MFGGSIRFSTAALRSGEYPESSSYPAHLRNRGKVERRTTTLTQGDPAPGNTAATPAPVWCAVGSGVLARGLATAWPKARRHVVQIDRDLTPREVGGATIHVHPRKFSDRAALGAPFPADPHYDAKAWELCLAKHGPGRVLFWNVAPLASC